MITGEDEEEGEEAEDEKGCGARGEVGVCSVDILFVWFGLVGDVW